MKPPITAEQLRSLVHYDPDTGVFTRTTASGRFPAGRKIGTPDGQGYLVAQIAGGQRKLHQMAFLYMTGRMPAGAIDHKNEQKSDNRWVNLREVTTQQNGFNRSKANISDRRTSKHLGVYFHKATGKFMARIKVDGQSKFLGLFSDEGEASLAYLRAKKTMHPLPPANDNHQAAEAAIAS